MTQTVKREVNSSEAVFYMAMELSKNKWVDDRPKTRERDRGDRGV